MLRFPLSIMLMYVRSKAHRCANCSWERPRDWRRFRIRAPRTRSAWFVGIVKKVRGKPTREMGLWLSAARGIRWNVAAVRKGRATETHRCVGGRTSTALGRRLLRIAQDEPVGLCVRMDGLRIAADERGSVFFDQCLTSAQRLGAVRGLAGVLMSVVAGVVGELRVVGGRRRPTRYGGGT